MTAKQKILEAIEQLPDEVSIDEAIERLNPIRAIEQGRAQVEAGEVISHEEILREFVQES